MNKGHKQSQQRRTSTTCPRYLRYGNAEAHLWYTSAQRRGHRSRTAASKHRSKMEFHTEHHKRESRSDGLWWLDPERSAHSAATNPTLLYSLHTNLTRGAGRQRSVQTARCAAQPVPVEEAGKWIESYLGLTSSKYEQHWSCGSCSRTRGIMLE